MGGEQITNFIPLSDVFSLIYNSRKQEVNCIKQMIVPATIKE